ncbi:MAG: endolytic transglycosylase MltG [Salinivirgaceae bacterium]|nr:endolytic transglycosylase MltG [Salinivirgaceae bacterium]MDD4746239.1 endolytic transglycosylase MltG [Salinivirgaceae bacterium]
MRTKTDTHFYLYNMIKKLLLIFGLFSAIIVALLTWTFYSTFYKNVELKSGANCTIFISTETTWEEINLQIQDGFKIDNQTLYQSIINYKSLSSTFKTGHYTFSKPIPLNQIVNTLKNGNQTPIKIVFNTLRDLSELAGIIAKQMMFDSTELIETLTNVDIQKQYNYNKESFGTMFIPNTYEFYWTVSPSKFVERMNSEHNLFWDKQRLLKAKEISLTPTEVSILASIVEKETSVKSEMSTVAGVYLNRIKRKMPLQADPTVIYAMGDFSIRRVTFKMLETESPYNTYKYRGLPPGPICIPSSIAIDAVLNHKKHDYLYFCASPNMDGSHLFAKTLRQHNQNANEYQKMLNKMRIYK